MLSDDEIASYEPTTPFKAVPVNLKKTVARTTKPSSRSGPVAGPSSKPASGQPAAKRKHNHKSPEPSDSEAGRLGLGEDVEVTDTGKGKPNKGQVTVDANGKATLKGKGKAKAEPQPKNPTKVDTTDVDEADVVDDTEGEAVAKAPVRTTTVAKAKKPPATASRSTKSSEKELNRLRQKIADVEGQRDALSTQLDEVFHERNTAAEESLDHQSLQYEARLKTQEKLIQELTSQLARVEPLARSGKTSLLHFLTRDAADEEQRGLENEVNHWKDIAQAKDAVLAEKDRRIAELERLERDVQYELKAEIERSKSLASKASRNQPPGSATRGRGIGGGIFGADEPKNTAVIKFYEDLTNLLVPNVKIETGKYLGLDETSFTCVYTYVDLNKAQNEEGDRGKEKSLSFTLRFYYDLLIPEEERTSADEHVTSHNQLTQRIKYTPLELDKESFDFVEKLKFLGDSFTFGPDQLALFLKTMYETLGGAIKEDDEDEMDE